MSHDINVSHEITSFVESLPCFPSMGVRCEVTELAEYVEVKLTLGSDAPDILLFPKELSIPEISELLETMMVSQANDMVNYDDYLDSLGLYLNIMPLVNKDLGLSYSPSDVKVIISGDGYEVSIEDTDGGLETSIDIVGIDLSYEALSPLVGAHDRVAFPGLLRDAFLEALSIELSDLGSELFTEPEDSLAPYTSYSANHSKLVAAMQEVLDI